jgi:hypothetical protein
MRLTVGETQEYIKQNLKLDVSYKTVRNYRYKQKGSAMAWIKSLARSKRADYVYQYKERIDEVQSVQRKLWEILNNPHANLGVQVKAAEALLHCSSELCSFFDAMPIVNSMSDYINGKYGNVPGWNKDRDRDRTYWSSNDSNSYGVSGDDSSDGAPPTSSE